MRERALFHAREEHDRVFEALRGVQGHQRDLAGVFVLAGQLVGVGDEGRGFEESGERGVRRLLLEFGGGGLQLGEVLDARFVLRVGGCA